jgi:replicative DNA helicase
MTESADKANIAADHLVGNLYFNLDALPIVAGVLSPEMVRFAVGGNAAIAYSEMCRLLRSDERLSAGGLEAGLRKVGFDFGWLAKLQSRITVEGLPTLHNYAGEIVNHAELLKVQQFSHEAITAAQADGAKAATVKGELLAKLSAEQRSMDSVEHASVIGARVRERLAEVKAGKVWGASTGFKSLDRQFRLVDGELVVVAGRPSQGKTSLARMIFYYRAMELARNDEHGQVVFFSSDDTSDKFIMDLACTMAQVDSNRIKDRTAGKDEWDRLEHEFMIIESLPLFVDGTPRPTVEHMYFKCAMLNAQKPIKLAGQDYAGLIRVDDAKSERQEAERAFTGVKGIGNTLRFPWVELSQINKGVENRADKWPTPSDLMYAGEAEANVCLTIMRPEHYISRGEDIDCDDKYKTGVALVNVGKNKSGKIGVVPMAFRPEYTRFDDLSFERTDLNNY